MPRQLHRRLSTEQVKAIFAKHETGDLTAREAAKYLELGRTRFYELLAAYRQDATGFAVMYHRTQPTRRLEAVLEQRILQELTIEKEKIIDNPEVPTDRYNYSYVRQLLLEKEGKAPAVSTIIARAKKSGHWKPKPAKRVHDREVITNYPGELIQHDSSHHLFAPDSGMKWYLITSLDDYSRTLLYADLWLRESTWAHIMAVQSVVSLYGAPFSYYADQHAIFRYVKERDKHRPVATYTKFTGDVTTQWGEVLKACGIKPIYALSPEAKGKIERPYRWLQDHLVRSCVRGGVTEIQAARDILRGEVSRYNNRLVHSTTGEIPMIRFEQARQGGRTLFREFQIPTPFQSAKDIFCLRDQRTVDSYRRISLHGLELTVPGGNPRETIDLRLIPDLATGVTEVRFWRNKTFLGMQLIKNDELKGVRF